jgi:hypothetical protein
MVSIWFTRVSGRIRLNPVGSYLNLELLVVNCFFQKKRG